MSVKITLLIPMYNEKEILPETLDTVSRYMKETFCEGYEILYVDDGSTDNSAAIVQKHPDRATRVLRYKQNRGKGCAVRTGMLAAEGEIILFTDCDLAYGTAALGEMIKWLEERPALGAVVGSRHLHHEGYAGYSFARKLFSRTYRGVLRLFFGLRLSDSQSGIKVFRRAAAREIFSRCETDRYAFDFEAIMIADKLGIAVGEMPVRVLKNNPGKIRLLRDSLRMLRDLVRIKRRVRGMERTGRF